MNYFSRFIGIVLGLALTMGFFHDASAQNLSKRGAADSARKVIGPAPIEPTDVLSFTNIDFGPLYGSPDQMARTYLQANHQKLNMKSGIADLDVALVQHAPGGTHIRYTQKFENIPVHQADVVVSLDSKNSVQFLNSNYKSGFTVTSTNPKIAKSSALQMAKSYLGVTGALHGEEKAELMINVINNRGRLSYKVTIPAFEPRGDWEVFVDALSGEVISVEDKTCFHRSLDDPKPLESSNKNLGSGYVFDPDPLTTALATYGDPGFVDGNDADTPQLTAQRVLRPLPDLTFSGGVYRLKGPYVEVFDWDLPTIAPVTATHADSFRFTRNQFGFEDVMVYHFLDKSQRYMQSLGFNNIQNLSIQADPHGFNGADNSSYTPSTNRLNFGQGGVDDAEDADVILHEYGHAIHHGSVPGWSGSGQQGALGEGFGDYWAESYSRGLNFWQPANPPYFWTFDWDGHNPFWAGRILNYALLYPGGLVNQVHTDGQMWASTLMSIWNQIGQEVLDKLVLKSHFYLAASGVTMKINAEAVIQADRDLYGGTHIPTLVYWFGQRGFINPALYIPNITHTPLADTENMVGPYEVKATIVMGASPLNLSTLKVFWGRTGAITDSLSMTATGVANEFRALIPGNGLAATYRYYVYAKDSSGAAATHPINAPTAFHSFKAGLVTVKPVFTHTPLRDQARLRWPATVRATVTDNIGVDSAWVDFVRLRGSFGGSFGLIKGTGSEYAGTFPLDTNQVVVGDTIVYKVVARDKATSGNITTSPSVGFHRFAIISVKGVVLVVDDDGTTSEKFDVSEKGVTPYDPALKGVTGRLFLRTLTDAGYLVDTASFALHNPATYPNYDIVVWTGGQKGTGVFGDVAKRAALVSRASTGAKIWVEGGEVGYVFRKSGTTTDLDPPFRQRVLHDSSWHSDVTSSSLVRYLPNHPIFTYPNPITSNVVFAGTSVNGRDAMRLIPGDVGAYKVGGWSVYTGAGAGPDTAGLIVYDNNPNPLSAQIVFFAFAVNAISDTMVAKQLIENTAEFLLTPEAAATGSLAGVVSLGGTADWSGVKVKVQGVTLAHADSATTGTNGMYTFSGLYAGTYRVSVSKTGFVPVPLSRDTTVGTGAVTGFNFALTPLLNSRVTGTVTLAGATTHDSVLVTIAGQGISAYTAANGTYTINNITPGAIRVQATKLGYDPTFVDTVLANGGTLTINFSLTVATLYLSESFEGATTFPQGWSHAVVTTGSTAPAWSIITGVGTYPSASPYSGTNQAKFNSFNATAGSQSRLTSKRFGIPAGTARVTFWMYRDDGYATDFDSITVQATTGDSVTGPWTRLGNFIRNSSTNGWKKDSVDLNAFTNQSKVFVSFLATSRYGNNMYLDEVNVLGAQGPVSVAEELPVVFGISQNYPNPFNPTTSIRYALPTEAVVTLKVYNILGQEIVTLVADAQTRGHHEVVWNGRNSSGAQVASGLYFYRIDAAPTDNAPRFNQIMKMMLLK